MYEIEDHAFTVEVDIVKFDQASDRIVLNGFLGEINEIRYQDNKLVIVGDEASVSLSIKKEELGKIFESTAFDN
jgi:hypothetical protein